MADTKNNAVVEIIVGSLIIGAIVYFFTQCLPKQTAGFYKAPGNCNSGYSSMDMEIIEEHDCIIPDTMLDEFPNNEPDFASLTPDDQRTWDKLR